jgi:hypothetical protein
LERSIAMNAMLSRPRGATAGVAVQRVMDFSSKLG